MSFTPRAVNVKYRAGRRVMLAGVTLFALTHILGYLPTAEPRNLPIAWTRITAFVPVWFWIAAWGVTLVLSITESFAGKGRKAISLTMGLSLAMAGAYVASYIATIHLHGWGSREWYYVGMFAGFSTIVYGLLKKVGALKLEAPEEDE